MPGYPAVCRETGILSVRIVYGKGTGTLATGVHAVLDRLEIVESHTLRGHTDGGWGATRVRLKT